MSAQHTLGRVDYIGVGLGVDHDYSAPIKPQAVREGPGRYRAEISGVIRGSVIRQWASPDTFATRGEALRAAIAKATGSAS